MTEPQVSIITATYNRSNVLRYTIASVLRSQFTSWEQIVVGDACTDDSEAVVAGFGDPRLRFYNLRQNVGEQSGPNNVGVAYARGRYIAFLNHDDLWFPDHLGAAVAALERSGADLVFTQALSVLRDGSFWLLGNTPDGKYTPHTFVPASLWLMRRELLARVGLWPPGRASFNAPSQAWLWRAWRAGAQLRSVPRVTMLVLPSGFRPGGYARRDWDEHRQLYARLCDEADFRERALEQALTSQVNRWTALSLATPLRQLARSLIYRGALALGVPPLSVNYALRYGRRGGMLAYLRRVRGLPRRVDPS